MGSDSSCDIGHPMSLRFNILAESECETAAARMNNVHRPTAVIEDSKPNENTFTSASELTDFWLEIKQTFSNNPPFLQILRYGTFLRLYLTVTKKFNLIHK
ncbi:hypothetical protein AVEN_197791-1 [Araneus ventricosus]|uniref:Uncharacterized protein n=1 Tax=Araneus ventricosus TaxID=182803 RepID=A0A4Y2HN66_ARAVE|nr:hypothetical protein AVEN_197791-1 [Araneus ventricosus]